MSTASTMIREYNVAVLRNGEYTFINSVTGKGIILHFETYLDDNPLNPIAGKRTLRSYEWDKRYWCLAIFDEKVGQFIITNNQLRNPDKVFVKMVTAIVTTINARIKGDNSVCPSYQFKVATCITYQTDSNGNEVELCLPRYQCVRSNTFLKSVRSIENGVCSSCERIIKTATGKRVKRDRGSRAA